MPKKINWNKSKKTSKSKDGLT